MKTHRRSPLGYLLLAALVAGAVAPSDVAEAKKKRAEKQEQEEEQIDYLALAARMIKDGHFDRAETMLRQVDLQKPDTDLPRYNTLYALVHLKRQEFAQAKEFLGKALKAGSQDKSAYLFLAQANFGLQDWAGTVKALDAAGADLTGSPEIAAMRATCHWNQKQHEQAFDVLAAARKRWPEATTLQKMRVFYLVDLGLYQAAVEEGAAYLERPDAQADDFVAVAEALKRGREIGKAIEIMQRARLRHPFDVNVMVQLAHLYMEAGQANTAAYFFNEASLLDERYRLEAAELYRKADRAELALAKNAGVADQEKKMKQRLSILLKMERFELVTAMEPRLSRLGLLAGQDIRYALAYAYYSLGDFKDAERHLKELRDPQLFEKATALRKAMAQCKEAGWECL